MTEGASGAAPEARRSDLMVRTIAGVAMIAVAVGCLSLGGLAFWALVFAAALLMTAEWAGLMGAGTPRMKIAIAGMIVPLAIASPLADGTNGLALFLLAGAAGVVAILTTIRLGAGLIYVGLPSLGLLYLRDQPAGAALVLWTLAIVWATDIGGYAAGKSIGGPKLAPAISPNKTWAGLGGGVAAALATGAAIAYAADLPPMLLLLGAPLAVLAQAGDLFESWLKRRAGMKDSGHLLPGHGGVLDRLDGLVPVAIFMALLIVAGAP